MSKTLEYSTLEPASKWRNLPTPPGFSKSVSSKSASSKTHAPSPESYNQLKEKRALDFATAPAKSLPMQAFMLYMSGGGVQIFSMGIVFMLLLTPFKNLAGINDAFAQFAPSTAKNPKALTTLALQKFVYVACNVLTLMVGLWKCRSMGLLPLGTGDWLAFETRGIAPEMSLF
ncbi:endoplasmic reticulum protein [Mycena rosella]|uniref:ER membrane protein complex subunit 4 n=1 Tax=Mycena rosella TaxID=1033263 RepID=A0AAD7D3G1_MYCRO|nr:endoplasmic reticulum protein [Mycena rosella]